MCDLNIYKNLGVKISKLHLYELTLPNGFKLITCMHLFLNDVFIRTMYDDVFMTNKFFDVPNQIT